jgi:hypothetical protein
MSRNTVRKHLGNISSETSGDTSLEVVNIVSSGVCKAPPPDVRAERDGIIWEFWPDTESDDHYIDSVGARIPSSYVEPYIIWRAKPPPHAPL